MNSLSITDLQAENVIESPPLSHNLSLNKNLWSVVKIRLYEGGKQYKSTADIWEAIKTTIEPAEVKNKRTKSVDIRLVAVIERKGHQIKK